MSAARRLATPLIRQSRHGCVNAALAMLDRARGLEPREHGLPESEEGVTDARLDRHLRALGRTPVDIACEPAAVRAELCLGRPLLMTISRWIGSHMGLIVGFDDRTGELTWLDPNHDQPRRLREEDLPGRRAEPGSALVTVLLPGDPPPPLSSRDLLRDLEREVGVALARGDSERARALADGANTALAEARLAWRFAALFPATDADSRAEALLACPEAGPILHSRALLDLVRRGGEAALDRHRATLRALPAQVRTLVDVQRAAADGELELALRRLEVAIAREPEEPALRRLRARWRARLER